MKFAWWNRCVRFSLPFVRGGQGGVDLPPPSPSLQRRGWYLLLPLFFLLSCEKAKPTLEYMPDMANQSSVKAQEEMRIPVAGTLPRDYVPYPYKGKPEEAGANLKNPFVPTMEVLKAGRSTFETYCAVCHGTTGLGNGSIVPKFPRPPALVSEKVQSWSDGRIYHVITEGQNLMPSYASQISPEDRWAVIHYIRVLQKAANPSPADVEKVKELMKKD